MTFIITNSWQVSALCYLIKKILNQIVPLSITFTLIYYIDEWEELIRLPNEQGKI